MRELKPLPDFINGVKVIRDLGMNNQVPRKRIALFKCECGSSFTAKINAVLVGHKRSCGCLKHKPTTYTHRLSKHPLYRKWSGMITRTTNRNENRWHRYGGRGISVCDEWRKDFMSFYNWSIKNGWEHGLTIDRINNDGDYEPENCQWITMKENTSKDSLKFAPTLDQELQVCNMYTEDKYTVTAIANIFGTYKKRISDILRKYNITIVNRRMKK